MATNDINERFSRVIRPSFTNFLNESLNLGVSEESKRENVGGGIFTSQMSKELPKYNNTYTFAGQTNISISPSSIPNPNPSLISNSNLPAMGMNLDQCYQPYGPYLYPIQSFPGYQTMYPSMMAMNQPPITQDNMRMITSNPLDQINVSTQNELDKTENSNVKPNIIELDKPKESEGQGQSIISISVENDNNLGIGKGIGPIVPDFANINQKSIPLKVDKQTGPGVNSYVKILKGPEIIPSTTVSNTTTNSFSTNNGPFTLKTSIPISKIDMRTIQPPINSKPTLEVVQSQPSEIQTVIQTDVHQVTQPTTREQGNQVDTQINTINDPKQNFFHQVTQPTTREQGNQVDTQINTKNDPKQTFFHQVTQPTTREQGNQVDTQTNTINDSKQNFFHQGNAVGHPHNIIKMLVPTQTCDAQTNTDNNRNKPQIISDILLKPIDTHHKGNDNFGQAFVSTNSLNLPIKINNPTINIIRSESDTTISKQDALIKPNTDGQPLEINNDLKKQYVFIQNPHMANKLLLSISSKQASNSIILPKVQTQEDGRINNNKFIKPQLPERLKESVNVSETSIKRNNKVVALKKLHHENCDENENDFENLITENQIYGNKLVMKEKSQSVFVHPANVLPNQNKLVKNEPVIAKDAVTKANLVVQPNFLYVSNYKLQPNASNFMVINNNTLSATQPINDQSTPAINKNSESKTETINQTTSQNKVMFGTQSFRTVNPMTHTVSYVKTNNMVDINKQGTVLQTLLSKPNMKATETNQGTKPNNQKVIGQIMNNKIVYQVPMIIDRNNVTNRAVNIVKPTYLNSELAMLLTKSKNQKVHFYNSKYATNKTLNQNNEDAKTVCGEESSLDLAEKRKIAREKRRLSLSKKSTSDEEIGANKEKEKYLSSQHYYYEEDSDESEYLSEDEDVDVVTNQKSKIVFESCDGKLEFLNMFELTTKSIKKEKELDKLERSIKMDLITSANVAAKADKLTKQIEEMESIEYGEQAYSLPVPNITENPITNESKDKITDKIIFMNELKLGMVPHSYKIEHEMMWQHILKDRKKRNGGSSLTDYLEKLFKAQNFPTNNNTPIDIHTRDQLEIMTKIKQSVLENNNLIKLKLDKLNQTNEPDNEIPFLAEKNFSEIQKLSYMANKSLTILRVTQDLKDALFSLKQPSNLCNLSDQQKTLTFPTFHCQNSAHLNIPKIVSLKSTEVQCNNIDISPATSMDEPRNSAGGVNSNPNDKCKSDASQVSNTQTIQTDNVAANNSVETKQSYQWPGLHAVLESYKVYSTECDFERQRLLEKNESLKNEIALKEKDGGCLGAHLRLLLAEQQMCEDQRQILQKSIDTLTNCISQITA